MCCIPNMYALLYTKVTTNHIKTLTCIVYKYITQNMCPHCGSMHAAKLTNNKTSDVTRAFVHQAE